MSALGAMLAADVSVHADGGGKRPASPSPIFGFEEVMKLHAQLAEQFRTHQSKLVRTVFINGLPGFVTLEADGELQTTTLDIEDGRITAIYVVRNPDKLRHLH
jgi:RNA polymerase sigma-70 factor (ECF subfamily)